MQVLGPPTFGIGGHDFLIGPRCPCSVLVTEDDHLVIAHDLQEVARIIPGEGLELADGVEYEHVFASLDRGAGASPWTVLARGFAVELPPGVILLPGETPDDPFELHAQGARHQFISFKVIPANARPRPGAGQELIVEDFFHAVESNGTKRRIDVTEVAYTIDGVAWRQAFLRVPFRDVQMVVLAQATEARRDDLFDAAKHVAATLGPFPTGR